MRRRAIRRRWPARFKRVAVCLAGVLVLDGCGRTPAYTLEKDVVLPCELVNRIVYVKVQVAGSGPLAFVLDTGAETTLIDLQVARSLGLDLQGAVPIGGNGAGKEAGRVVRNASCVLPGLPELAQPISLALPLDRLAKVAGHEFSGILGYDLLSRFVVEIDYLGRAVILHDRGRFRYEGGGEVLPMTLGSDKHPRIAAGIVLDGREPLQGTFVLDIGASAALSLSSPFVKQQRLLEANPSALRRIVAQGAGGKVEGAVGRIARLRLGHLSLDRPVTTFSTMSGGALASSDVQGHIGGAVLEKFRLFLDYGRDRIILEPNSRFPEPLEYDMSGVNLLGEGEDYRAPTIDEVYPDTPASEAGLRKGDVLIAVDGRPAAGWSLSDIREALRHERAVGLTIRRGEERREVTLRLRRLV